MKAVIMAGGRGTRISELFPGIPKPMVPIGGIPVLERSIVQLRNNDIREILISVKHKYQSIIDYFGDGSGTSPVTGEKFGVSIEYIIEKSPVGNAGALFFKRDELSEDFLLLNADIVFEVDIRKLLAFHSEKRSIATLVAHPNDHPFDSGLLVVDDEDEVKRWLSPEDEREGYYSNLVNAGIHIISPVALDKADKKPGDFVDLDRDLLKPLCGSGGLFAYKTSEYIKDMGTPERYSAVERDCAKGLPRAKAFATPKRAVFLDRDGTLNELNGFIANPDELNVIPGSGDALRRINQQGVLAIVVTNQPVIARGEASTGQLRRIHDKLEDVLGASGAYVDAIYYCPHHPDKGFDGEVEELKRSCTCRKPSPGLFYRAADDFNIDLGESWMVGDSVIDVQAAHAAGCRAILLTDDLRLAREVGAAPASSLSEAVDVIFSGM